MARITTRAQYARSVCDMNSAAAAAVCSLWRYMSVTPGFQHNVAFPVAVSV